MEASGTDTGLLFKLCAVSFDLASVFCVPVVISLFTNGAGEAAGEAASQITPAMIQLLMEQPMTIEPARKESYLI